MAENYYYQLYDSYNDNYGIIRSTLKPKELDEILHNLRKERPEDYDTEMLWAKLSEKDKNWEIINIELIYF